MNINLLENSEIGKNNLEIENKMLNVSVENQTKFLNGFFGQAVNVALDIGIRSALPDYIEDIIINIKDTLLTEGFQDGMKTIINSAINIGKSAIGIFTGKFETIEQLESAIKKGGIIDKSSDLLDDILEKVKDKKLIDNNTLKLIKEGKNIILKSIDKNIEDNMSLQIKAIENLSKYSENWNNCYLEKNFNGMEKEYKKIQKTINEIIPLEKTIKKVREIENIHNLIKNNKENFELSKDELELAKKLV